MPLASVFNTTFPLQAGQTTLNVSMKSAVIGNASFPSREPSTVNRDKDKAVNRKP